MILFFTVQTCESFTRCSLFCLSRFGIIIFLLAFHRWSFSWPQQSGCHFKVLDQTTTRKLHIWQEWRHMQCTIGLIIAGSLPELQMMISWMATLTEIGTKLLMSGRRMELILISSLEVNYTFWEKIFTELQLEAHSVTSVKLRSDWDTLLKKGILQYILWIWVLWSASKCIFDVVLVDLKYPQLGHSISIQTKCSQHFRVGDVQVRIFTKE